MTRIRFRRLDPKASGGGPWLDAPDSPDLAEHEVQLWFFDLEPRDDIRRLFELLAPTERARADTFRFARHRCRYVAGRGRLRQILGRYGVDRAVFVAGPHGKPKLADGSLKFNLAHSERIALCAVTRTKEIGVDLEVVRRDRRPQWDAIARRYFSDAEVRLLRRVPRYREFLRIWTLKEACLKAAGTGLTVDPRSVDVTAFLAGRSRVAACGGETWRCLELAPVRDAVAALALTA
ncbi:MAG: 4'-phosphopantetheinyl transferase superfamily protein [Actinomycetota bacterium]|nr:4'-phosphopantetheinyl transferase superfamily protein [Actinomycetota bacterium]